MPLLTDPSAWRTKAMAFVTRSHRHLWGKNNEDPQAFLFTRGLKNQFLKDLLAGWNKFGQNRPLKNWGFRTDPGTDEKFYLAPGIVVPFIVQKTLISVILQPYETSFTPFLVPGSQCPTMVLGQKNRPVAVVQDLFDGLFLFQETGGSHCVMIHLFPDETLKTALDAMVKSGRSVSVFSVETSGCMAGKTDLNGLPDHCFHTYLSKEELKAQCLMH